MTSEQVAERDAIEAAHPLRSGRHDLYNKAMRLVGERHAKGDLVDLVVWLLLCAEPPAKIDLGDGILLTPEQAAARRAADARIGKLAREHDRLCGCQDCRDLRF